MKNNPRRTVLAFFLAAAVPVFLYAAHDTTVDDIIAMSRAHVSDATILLFVEKNQICLPLSSDDLTRMRRAGLSRLLIDSLVDRMANCQTDESVAYDTTSVDEYPVYPPDYYSSYYYPYYGFGSFPSYFFFDHHHYFLGGHHFGGRRGAVHHAVHRGGVHRVSPRAAGFHGGESARASGGSGGGHSVSGHVGSPGGHIGGHGGGRSGGHGGGGGHR